MKISILSFLVILFLFCSHSKAQIFGNEWINYSQKYYQFPINQTGVYRIDHAQLLASGIPVNTFSSQNIQVFGK